MDEVALHSQQRAKMAWDRGHFDAEVTGVMLRTRKGEMTYVADEHIRPDTTIEGLSALRPYFKDDGLVTAGNASGMGDGSATAILASAE